MPTRLGLAVLWLLHRLPLRMLACIGTALGTLLYVLAAERRSVTSRNLGLCFPERSAPERDRLARAHFRAFGRGLLDHGVLWWGSRERVQQMVQLEGLEHWQSVEQRPVILFAPHFVGFDMGGARIITQRRGVSVYSRQKNPDFDRVLLRGRTRFETSELYSRQDGIRPVVRAMRRGLPLYYLPDMDFGDRDSIFVPFFGVPAATITGLARIARLARAVVVPAVTRQLPDGRGYVLRFYPAWDNFPTDDVVADTRRMNAFIEERVREMPEQYFWLHKRFKTRPPGEPRVYS